MHTTATRSFSRSMSEDEIQESIADWDDEKAHESIVDVYRSAMELGLLHVDDAA